MEEGIKVLYKSENIVEVLEAADVAMLEHSISIEDVMIVSTNRNICIFGVEIGVFPRHLLQANLYLDMQKLDNAQIGTRYYDWTVYLREPRNESNDFDSVEIMSISELIIDLNDLSSIYSWGLQKGVPKGMTLQFFLIEKPKKLVTSARKLFEEYVGIMIKNHPNSPASKEEFLKMYDNS
jgi:hypothetical protein